MDDLINIELTARDWSVVLACVEEAAREFKVAPWEIGPEDDVRAIAQDMDRIHRIVSGQARSSTIEGARTVRAAFS